MECWKKSPLLPLPDKIILDIRTINNLDNPEIMEEAVNILENWLIKQDHILKRENFSKKYLEKTLITSKGSVEKAKKQLDRFATTKTLLPHFFLESVSEVDFMKKFIDFGLLVPLPKLTKEHYRIIVIKLNNQNFDSNVYKIAYKLAMIITEYLHIFDYVAGYMVIFDLSDISLMNLMTTLNLIDLHQLAMMMSECYGCRFKGIYPLTESKTIEVLIKALKPLLSEKLMNRIHNVPTPEALKEFISPEILPSEYGGTEKSLNEMWHEWIEEVSTPEHLKHMEMMNEIRTDENLRTPCEFNEDYLGIPGTFRNLKVD